MEKHSVDGTPEKSHALAEVNLDGNYYASQASISGQHEAEQQWPANTVEVGTGEYSQEFFVEFEPRRHKFNIVDFHLPQHPANLEQIFPQSSKEESIRYVTLFGLALCVGFFVAVIGWFIETGVKWTSAGLYGLTQTTLLENDRFWPGVVAFVLLSLLLALMSSALVVFVSPLAAGSGIPEIKSYLNGVQLPGLVSIKTLLAKSVGVCLSIASGMICGREGPMIHAGGIVGSGVAVAASRVLQFRVGFKGWDYFRTHAWKRDFTAMGAAAGVGVAFQAPVGGILFLVEEAATHWSQQMTWATLLAAAIATIFASTIEVIAHGGLSFNISTFGIFSGELSNSPFYLKDMGFYIFIGIIGGLFGGVLSLIQKPLTLFRFKFVNRTWTRLLETAFISLLTSFLRVLIPSVHSEQCIPVNEAFEAALAVKAEKDYSRFTCPERQENPFASLVWSPMDVSIQNLLHNSDVNAWGPGILIGALAFYACLTVITYGIAVPSGLFIPAYQVGALIGRLVGLLAAAAFPDDRADFNIGTYAFMGAVSGLAGATRMTMSVVMIAVETTAYGSAILPALIVALVAKFVGDSISTGIYDLHIHLKGIPILEERIMEETQWYYKIRCRDIMARNVAAIYDVSTVSDLVFVLSKFKYGSFPVVSRARKGMQVHHGTHHDLHEDDGAEEKNVEEISGVDGGLLDFSRVQFKGMINRPTIVAVLKHYTTLVRPNEEGDFRFLPRNRYDVAYPNTNLITEEETILRDLPSEILHAPVNLDPYVDRNPPTISDNATAAEVRDVFRRRGIRHAVCVWMRTGKIVGIVTRKDILPETIRSTAEKLRDLYGDELPAWPGTKCGPDSKHE